MFYYKKFVNIRLFLFYFLVPTSIFRETYFNLSNFIHIQPSFPNLWKRPAPSIISCSVNRRLTASSYSFKR